MLLNCPDFVFFEPICFDKTAGSRQHIRHIWRETMKDRKFQKLLSEAFQLWINFKIHIVFLPGVVVTNSKEGRCLSVEKARQLFDANDQNQNPNVPRRRSFSRGEAPDRWCNQQTQGFKPTKIKGIKRTNHVQPCLNQSLWSLKIKLTFQVAKVFSNGILAVVHTLFAGRSVQKGTVSHLGSSFFSRYQKLLDTATGSHLWP